MQTNLCDSRLVRISWKGKGKGLWRGGLLRIGEDWVNSHKKSILIVVDYFMGDVVDYFMGVYIYQLIKFYTLNMCSFLYIK